MQRIVERARQRGRSGRARRAVLSPKPERKAGRKAAVLRSCPAACRGVGAPRGYLLNRPPAFTFRPPFPPTPRNGFPPPPAVPVPSRPARTG